ncbi:MAG TPA: hypothetical protein VIK14_11990 [Ignavibacteria bacterium]
MQDLYKRNIIDLLNDVERYNIDITNPEYKTEKVVYLYGTSYYTIITDYNFDKLENEIKFKKRLEQLQWKPQKK